MPKNRNFSIFFDGAAARLRCIKIRSSRVLERVEKSLIAQKKRNQKLFGSSECRSPKFFWKREMEFYMKSCCGGNNLAET